MPKPVFRFAPSPTGYLHLGHAFAALSNQKLCKVYNGKMLLRMENTDLGRCTREFEDAIIDDLEWMGFEWLGDIRRQSDYFSHYASVMEKLDTANLVYPAVLTRGEIRHTVEQIEKTGKTWPRDPDGAPHYPGNERTLEKKARILKIAGVDDYALRLDMKKTLRWLRDQQNSNLIWEEFGEQNNTKQEIKCQPELWGDVVLGRKDTPARYHLACVIDDGLQGVTHVVRGMDIYPATSIHRLLQEVLKIAPPQYHHHKLIVDETGRKLSKRHGDDSIQAMRKAGMKRSDLYEIIGINP